MKLNEELKMSIKRVDRRKIREIISKKHKIAILSLTHIFKLAIIITYIQYELQFNYQVLCRSRGVIYNKDGKFIYKPAKASQGHIIVIEDRHQETSSRSLSPQQTSSLLSPQVASSAYQPIQLIGSRSYQQASGIEGAGASTSPIRAAGVYANGQIQLINLSDLQSLVAPNHPSHANLASAASDSPNHYSMNSRLASQQPFQIIPLIQLYQPPKYPGSPVAERPYGFINVPTSGQAANLGINQEFDRQLHEHNPILDNGASIITPGSQYNHPAQAYQQHQHTNIPSINQKDALQIQAHAININQQPTRPRSDANSMNDIYDNSQSYDHHHERQPLADSAFFDDPLSAFRNILPHSEDSSMRHHASDSQVRSKISGFHDLDHVDDITDVTYGTLSQQPSRFNQLHITDISNLKNINQDGARSTFGRSASALPPLISLNSPSHSNNGSSNSSSSRDHVVELEDRHKKSLDTLSKSKPLKNSKRAARNKSKSTSESRKAENHFKHGSTMEDDLNSKDLKGSQYWNQFKDQFEIM